jgi:hypothetical protein
MSARRSRWVRRILAAGGLGAITTVLVAWGLAAFGELHRSEFRRPPELAKTSPRLHVPEGWTVRTWLESWGPGVDHRVVSECVWMGSTLGMTSGMGPQRTMLRAGMGWPWLALEYSDADDTNRTAKNWWELGMPLPDKLVSDRLWRSERRLPLRPLWRGAAADAALYGTVWLAVLAGVGAWRRHRRLKRGMCPECRYPLSEAAACSECGFGAGNGGSAQAGHDPKLPP